MSRCSFQDTGLQITEIAVQVYERAVRNCPWSGELWGDYLRAAERNGHSYKTVKGKEIFIRNNCAFWPFSKSIDPQNAMLAVCMAQLCRFSNLVARMLKLAMAVLQDCLSEVWRAVSALARTTCSSGPPGSTTSAAALTGNHQVLPHNEKNMMFLCVATF